MVRGSLIAIGIGFALCIAVVNSGITEDISEGWKMVGGFFKRNHHGSELVEFYLHTPKNSDGLLLNSSNTMKNIKSVLQEGKILKVIIHGWCSNPDRDWFQKLTSAYLSNGNSVILVDWRSMSWSLYDKSASNTRIVGDKVGEFLHDLKSNFSMPLNKIHIIGYSLGAHVAGFAGDYLFKKTSEKVDRITGIDPAGPNFESVGNDGRLDSSDAVFVDVIHTSAGKLGIKGPNGHVDFYPNGGTPDQPGCTINVGCSHLRALKYMIESVSDPNAFMTTACEDYTKKYCERDITLPITHMGEYASRQVKGSIYLITGEKSPFSSPHTIKTKIQILK